MFWKGVVITCFTKYTKVVYISVYLEIILQINTSFYFHWDLFIKMCLKNHIVYHKRRIFCPVTVIIGCFLSVLSFPKMYLC